MYLPAISPYLVNSGCGQSRTPVPTVLDYPNILMRALVTCSFFVGLDVSPQAADDIQGSKADQERTTVDKQQGTTYQFIKPHPHFAGGVAS